MNFLFQGILIWHVLLGLSGVALSVFVLITLLRDKVSLNFLKLSSIFSLFSFVGSWILGGYYYVNYYGSNVKPIIKGGDYSWAHSVVMETKEHVFLFLPFLAAVMAISVWMSNEKINENNEIRHALRLLSLVIVIIGIAVTLMGAVISGAYRP